MRVGVVVFPGSNCDHDAYHVLKHVMGCEARFVWHKDSDLSGLDAVVLPGGFAYGDYLRTGAIARFSCSKRSAMLHAQKRCVSYQRRRSCGFSMPRRRRSAAPKRFRRSSAGYFACRNAMKSRARPSRKP